MIPNWFYAPVSPGDVSTIGKTSPSFCAQTSAKEKPMVLKKSENKKPNVNVNDNVNDNENGNGNGLAHPTRHRYGQRAKPQSGILKRRGDEEGIGATSLKF